MLEFVTALLLTFVSINGIHVTVEFGLKSPQATVQAPVKSPSSSLPSTSLPKRESEGRP